MFHCFYFIIFILFCNLLATYAQLELYIGLLDFGLFFFLDCSWKEICFFFFVILKEGIGFFEKFGPSNQKQISIDFTKILNLKSKFGLRIHQMVLYISFQSSFFDIIYFLIYKFLRFL